MTQYKQNTLIQNSFVQNEINLIKAKYGNISQEYQFDIIKDRKKAIQYVISKLQKNDILIIAGKGHENYQIIGKDKFFFSDYECAIEYTNEKNQYM